MVSYVPRADTFGECTGPKPCKLATKVLATASL